MKTLLAVLLLLLGSNATSGDPTRSYRLSEYFEPGDRFMDIRLLGTVELLAPVIDGIDTAELSGLAWDAPRQRLYAISDNAALFHFKPRFEAGILVDLESLSAHHLRDRNGNMLRGKARDTEGLELVPGPSGPNLLISVERRHRIQEYSLTGRQIRSLQLPKPLQDPDHYSSANKSLESVTHHPQLGLITAPEFPLVGADQAQHRIYLRSPAGEDSSYRFPRHDPEHSGITAISSLEDGRLLILERTFVSLFTPVKIGLHLATLPERGDELEIHTVALFDNGRGWNVDNYEGLAYLGKGRFLMVSDNNQSPLQRTLLTHFELVTR